MLNVISVHLRPSTFLIVIQTQEETDVRSFIFRHPIVSFLFRFNQNKFMVDKDERFIYSAKLEKTAKVTYPPA
jgi:hypothetical protein